jgi:hypothetical protein
LDILVAKQSNRQSTCTLARQPVAGRGKLAVLTFRFDGFSAEGSMHWNATEVYQRDESGWRIIHIH